ncbi:hypothetical protein [Sphingomonas crusticola]|uniref:hypothetical protein n=1 Tax=Sphingomonas crusticola TaxID=1697973 RepID=UPI000E2824C2|nr:hypothetical protein [Sphingomonas crusticola]
MADEPDDEMTEDVGGVQGSEPEAAGLNLDGPAPKIASDAPEQPAPDAGEIEWAGTLLKRPPAPQN